MPCARSLSDVGVRFASGRWRHSSVMKYRQAIPSLAMLAALTLGTPAGVYGDDREKHDHDHVREALARGEVLPLPKILAIATQQVPGDVIEVELEDEDGGLVYEIKILTSKGRVREVEINA